MLVENVDNSYWCHIFIIFYAKKEVKPLRINIIKTTVDYTYLLNETEKFEDREALNPYIIMSQSTLNKLLETDCKIIVDDHGGYEIGDYKILVNSDLRFGEVDIR